MYKRPEDWARDASSEFGFQYALAIAGTYRPANFWTLAYNWLKNRCEPKDIEEAQKTIEHNLSKNRKGASHEILHNNN